jgi:hypothetical protein
VKYLPQHHVYPVHGKQVKEGKSNNLIDLAVAARADLDTTGVIFR